MLSLAAIDVSSQSQRAVFDVVNRDDARTYGLEAREGLPFDDLCYVEVAVSRWARTYRVSFVCTRNRSGL